MSQYKSEYSGVVVSGKPSGYSSLGCYYGQCMAPPKPNPNSQIIPNYSTIGYDALTKGGVGNKKSYYNVNDAYGPGSSSCATTYSTRLCGNIGGNKCTDGPAYFCATDQNFAECVQKNGYNGTRCASDSPCKKTTFCPVR
jgi:hypothetical protein